MTAKKKEFVPAKLGRKPLPEGAKRLDRVTIVLHESELDAIKQKASEEGFSSLSDWGRKTLLAATKD
jgi:predicted DNA binding CopG/RHH family protein